MTKVKGKLQMCKNKVILYFFFLLWVFLFSFFVAPAGGGFSSIVVIVLEFFVFVLGFPPFPFFSFYPREFGKAWKLT